MSKEQKIQLALDFPDAVARAAFEAKLRAFKSKHFAGHLHSSLVGHGGPDENESGSVVATPPGSGPAPYAPTKD
jgi:hypothetical protein